jgi:dTDP-4-amino-4,6-dideoxygalactose transaminase
MPEWVVPLSDVRFSDEEVEAVAQTYRSGWLSQGPKVAAFEEAFAAQFGSHHAIAVANGTAALQLVCAVLPLAAGDEVVLPSLTFAATAAAVVHAGAVPVFVDICGPARPWLSPAAAEAAITDKTRAIINVSYGGHPGEIDALRALAEKHGLALVEDAAHALGARVGERMAGTIGLAGAFSFFANKNMPLGEGGMVITDDAGLATRMRLLRSHGLTADTWARHTGERADYDVLEPGFNFRLDEARAALGLLLLRRLDADNERREQLAMRYAQALEALAGVDAAIRPDGLGAAVRSAWHIFPVLLDPAIDRDRLRRQLRNAGIQTSVHYPPLHLSTGFARWAKTPLEATEEYARRTVTIPLFAHMSDRQQALVVEAIREAAAGAA